ncbi:hypothetical protein ELQ90_10960 [Labedella phragmitis]|uniref:Uncharacterized protein n=1 Tax=Labedella phragmitis TaxID=2498849 RepID=A0A3S3Z6M6_9MICO|nr:hypothetical protein [Labedella phragmitis]RWZ49865.1 hypothetical protein ELQ90_10960 [Labedella phragmitis]
MTESAARGLDEWDDGSTRSPLAQPREVTRPEIHDRFGLIVDGTRYPLELGVDIEDFKRTIVSTTRNGGGFVTIPGMSGNYSLFVSTGLNLLIVRMPRD